MWRGGGGWEAARVGRRGEQDARTVCEGSMQVGVCERTACTQGSMHAGCAYLMPLKLKNAMLTIMMLIPTEICHELLSCTPQRKGVKRLRQSYIQESIRLISSTPEPWSHAHSYTHTHAHAHTHTRAHTHVLKHSFLRTVYGRQQPERVRNDQVSPMTYDTIIQGI